MTDRRDGEEASDGADRDRADASDEAPRGPPCPFCEARMFKRHCKYVCPHHGVVYDCSDPFR